jgi:hypothetical protein
LYGAETWYVFHEPRIWFHSRLAEKYHIIFVDLFERRFQPEKKLKTAKSKLSSRLLICLWSTCISVKNVYYYCMSWTQKLTLPLTWHEHTEGSSGITLLGPVLNSRWETVVSATPRLLKVNFLRQIFHTLNINQLKWVYRTISWNFTGTRKHEQA